MKLASWFKDPRVYRYNKTEEEFAFYKGFKITKVGRRYILEDIRFKDFYTPVKPKDKEILEREGFIKGCDLIMYKRNMKKIKLYNKKIEWLRNKIHYHQSQPETKFTKKRICNHTDRIAYFNDLVLLYTARIENSKLS